MTTATCPVCGADVETNVERAHIENVENDVQYLVSHRYWLNSAYEACQGSAHIINATPVNLEG